jgi:hypothetical protein
VSGYRDDLNAALARVEQLEAEAANLRRQVLQTPAWQERLADLGRRHAAAAQALREIDRATRRALQISLAVALVASVAFVGAIASLGPKGHPWNAAAASVVGTLALLGLVALVGRWARRERALEAEELERELADVHRAAAEPRQAARAARIAARPSEVADEPWDEAALEAPLAAPGRERA